MKTSAPVTKGALPNSIRIAKQHPSVFPEHSPSPHLKLFKILDVIALVSTTRYCAKSSGVFLFRTYIRYILRDSNMAVCQSLATARENFRSPFLRSFGKP